MLVLKFGGSSASSFEGVEKICNILKDEKHLDNTRAAVVSAMFGATDKLLVMTQKAVQGDTSYAETANELSQRHSELAGRFISGPALDNVTSLIKKTTSELVSVLDGIAALRDLSLRTQDLVLSFGERLSASVLTEIFNAEGIPSSYLDSRPLIKTDNVFGKANYIKADTYPRIRSYFDSLAIKADGKKIPLQVAAGFIGSTAEDFTTTLGRGGSDLSASLFAAALGCDEIEIWTDVDGILTADPKKVKNAFLIESISYEEAMELSHFGAKFIYPPTIKPAMEKDIAIQIRNAFNPICSGTAIIKEPQKTSYSIRGISSMENVALVRIQGSGMIGVAGFSSRLFSALAARKINIILITQASSEYSICFAVLPSDAVPAGQAAAAEFEQEIAIGSIDAPVIETDFSIIAVVGARMRKASGVSGKVFHSLGRNGISVAAIAQGSSELNISAVIARQDETKALNAVHEAFFLSGVRSVNLFLAGTGLIGGTLLEQISIHRDKLEKQHKVRINLIGAADFGKMLVSNEGLDPKTAKSVLLGEAGGEDRCEPYNLGNFVSLMKSFNLPNTCFCDCTASDEVAGWYANILEASISVVTPNKRANAGSYDYYQSLIGYSRNRGIPYLYETTVCAGLPVISTLRDLFLSGDNVRRIEAVLSGTLSFIFSSFDGSKTFSALLREAQSKGYTEPDPRDDLNAMDAARKALILARECGMPLEFSSVEIEPLLPPACLDASSVEEFYNELEKSDSDFEKRRATAASEGKRLCYTAVIENGKAKLSLRSEPENSPFRTLKDADNMVVITTDRYSSLPMVIKGPGAGAQVTAGGIFADIVRTARTLV